TDQSTQSAWSNTGNGWSSTSTWAPPVPVFYSGEYDPSAPGCADPSRRPPQVFSEDLGMRFGDLNGDGLIDILYSSYNNGYSSGAWLNNGNGWSYAPQWTPPVAF